MKANNQNYPLDIENLLLRGCTLRNTKYVIGMVVFTGPESKIMQNSAKARYKFSSLEILSNYTIYIVFLTQLVLAFLGSCVGTTWQYKASIVDANTNL